MYIVPNPSCISTLMPLMCTLMFVQERRWKFPLGMHEDLSGLLSREGIQVWCSGAGACSNARVYSRGKPQLRPRTNYGEASVATPLRHCWCLLCFMTDSSTRGVHWTSPSTNPTIAKRAEACCQRPSFFSFNHGVGLAR